ncbi:TnsD family transposase [Pseudomonas sp. Irchel 3F3]|uniref:TnsD family transposase n=1 Tax=Pseudomonas sp. Irchel 3F3 TaxID=2009000 RepID=UPI002114D484|nr:TnsD family transposase [Pseudomonas sp. Irchel 3F3]
MVRFALNWLEDETFFSICSRQHAYLCSIDSAATCEWLFGTYKGYVHDLNYNLGALNKFTTNWGTPESIINDHTIAPFFFPYQSLENVLAAKETLLGPRLGSLKYRLGLLTNRFGAEHPLKACIACMVCDRIRVGVAYWHLSHQYPGVTICPVHGLYLRESTKNRQWSGQFEWLLPGEEDLLPAPRIETTAATRKVLEDLVEAIIALASFGCQRIFDPSAVNAVYRTALAQYGERSSGQEAAASALWLHIKGLHAYQPFSCMPRSPEEALTFLRGLVRSPRGHVHPLKHLTLITWLFGSLGAFIKLHDQIVNSKTPSTTVLSGIVNSDKRVIEINSSSDRTLIAARRPKILKKDIRAAILLSLSQGQSKYSLCEGFGITISTLNKLIRSEPSVANAWKEKTTSTERLKRRSIWENTVKGFSKDSAKKIRCRVPSVYAWLYRNDREWLNSRLGELPNGRIGNHSAVDWSKRDQHLLEALKSTADYLLKSHELPLKKQQIYLALPRLASALQKRQAYELTRSFLQAITASAPIDSGSASAGCGTEALQSS